MAQKFSSRSRPARINFTSSRRASTNALAPSSDAEVVLSGKSTYAWWNATNSIHVEYGIERYYVAEGTGNPPRGKLTARAIVPASGHAKLQQVFLDGKPYEQAMKNAAP